MFGRLSTGIKMLVILTAALLPLGIIALLASLQSAEQNRASRNSASRLVATEAAERLNVFVARTAMMLRAATTALGDPQPGTPACARALNAIAGAYRVPVRLAVFRVDGQLACATPGFAPAVPPKLALAEASRVDIAPDMPALRLVVRAALSGTFAVAEIPRETVLRVARVNAPPGSYGLSIQGDGRQLNIARADGALSGWITVQAPFARQRLSVMLSLPETPVSSSELIMIVLPLFMWLAGAAIGWLVMDRLILRPLTQLQTAIGSFGTGDRRLIIPTITSPAKEIRRLGEAFRGVAQTVARHEAELEEGLLRQTRLTREVHHRVKNNLQVVASLLSLHARSAKTTDAAAAYASIQRRVDALAIVHRNHYAELEDNRGVALRPLIAELAANLRGSIPDDMQAPAITLDLRPYYAGQDVAVSVAFLVTELVEMALLCVPGGRIAISLVATDRPERAMLSVTSPALHDHACEDEDTTLRFNRVVLGLSRQLRSAIVRDDQGMIGIEIGVMTQGGYDAAQAAAAAPIAAVPAAQQPSGS